MFPQWFRNEKGFLDFLFYKLPPYHPNLFLPILLSHLLLPPYTSPLFCTVFAFVFSLFLSYSLCERIKKMPNNEAKFSVNQPLKTQKLFIGVQIFFRIVAIAASVASSWLMITSKQVIDIGGIVLDARYSYSPEFK